MKKVNIFCHSFQKVKPIYYIYIYSLHRVKNFKPLFLEMLMIMAYRKWKTKILCFRNFEYYIRSLKKGYFKHKWQASEKYVYLYEHGRFYERIKRSFIRFMYCNNCKSLWIKASAKWLNVNVNVLFTQYLVGAPFAWMTASMRRGMKVISPWHCSGVMKPRLLW